MTQNAEKFAEYPPRVQELLSTSHQLGDVRRCRRCEVRKVLALGFYRDRKSRGGYRRECKRCRNAVRQTWARRRRSEQRTA